MLTVSLILAGALAAQAPSTTPAAKDFVGSWNVRITDAPDTFVSGGFQITQKGEALAAGVIPFLFGDAVKAALSSLVAIYLGAFVDSLTADCHSPAPSPPGLV